MPISFACGQCGKSYSVSDGLAGKRAVCKACNNRMVIPGEPADTPATAPAAAPRPAPSARPASMTTSARPASAGPRGAAPAARAVPVARVVERTPSPPAEDLYGLDEAPAPLPPLMPRSAMNGTAAVDEAPARKKKKKGFFSKGKKKSSGGSFQYAGTGIGGLRLIGIVIGVVAGLVGSFSLMSKSSIEGVIVQLIAQANQTAATLEGIRDLPGAQAQASQVRAGFQAIITTLEKNKDRKGRKNDIDEINRKYSAQVESSFRRLGMAVGRASQVPGAEAALGLQPMMMRMMALLSELGSKG
jgi:hypothetical protein